MAPSPQYPHKDGDITVLGPEIFASLDGDVISWRGENYTRQACPAPTADDATATQTQPSALRQQIADALWNANGPSAAEDANIDAVLEVILPHGKFLGDQLRDSEQRLAETRTVLDEVLRHLVHKGHPGEPCLQTGWISVGTVERWRAVLYPPAQDGP
jgi:hypothetical protein